MNTDEQAREHRLDWALGEKLGGEVPPDLASRIVARHLRGEAPAAAPAAGAVRHRWIAAALILLGIGVVFAVALRPRQQPPAPQPVAPPQQPEPPRVHSLADVAALPEATRAVIVRDCGDDVAAALARLRDLEDVEWHVTDRECHGVEQALHLPRQAQCPAPSPAGLQAIGQLSKLRRLVLSGTSDVLTAASGSSAALSGLQRLPQLLELALRYLDLSDREHDDGFAVLPKLHALRRLDLSFNHGFGERGIDTLLRCQGLQALSLRGCQQLTSATLAKLGEMADLRELDLAWIDGSSWRISFADGRDPRIAALLAEASSGNTRGITDEAMRGIARCRTLRSLDLANSRITGTIAAALARLPQLEQLDLAGNPIGDDIVDALPPSLRSLRVGGSGESHAAFHEGVGLLRRGERENALDRFRASLRGQPCDQLTSAFCRRLAERLPRLEHLDLSECYGIGDDGVAALAGMPSLRRLELREMKGLTAACIAYLLRATQLQELDLRHCSFVTAAHVVALRRALPGLRELRSDVPEDAVQQADELPPAVVVNSREALDALPANTRNVEAIGLANGDLTALDRLQDLERLALLPTPSLRGEPWSDALRHGTDALGFTDLRVVKRLPRLRILVFCGAISPSMLDSLAAAPLQELSCSMIASEGLSKLQALPHLQRLGLGNKVDDKLVRSIAACHGLRELTLGWMGNPSSLAPLRELRQLRTLGLDRYEQLRDTLEDWYLQLLDPVDALLAGLEGMRLQSLDLRNRHVSATGIAHVANMTDLQHLSLEGTALDVLDLQQLPTSLTSLSLAACSMVDDGVGYVLGRRLPKLAELDLSRCPGLSSAVFTGLLKLEALEHLDLSYCRGLDDKAVQALAAARAPDGTPAVTKLKSLTLRGWTLDEAAMAALRSLPALQTVTTDAGVVQLR